MNEAAEAARELTDQMLGKYGDVDSERINRTYTYVMVLIAQGKVKTRQEALNIMAAFANGFSAGRNPEIPLPCGA